MPCTDVGEGVTGNNVPCVGVWGEESQEIMCYVQIFGGGVTGNDVLYAGVWGRSHRK